jgi:5-methylcytosine-specific restriction protein A
MTTLKNTTANTYLFVWNPEVWKWIHLEQSIEQLQKTGSVTEAWSCSSHKKVKPGDRAFLMKVGKSPKGIMASATIISNPFFSEFRSGEDKAVPRMRVILDFDVLLNPDKEPILTLERLKTSNLEKQQWTPQSSGISVRTEHIDELEAVWFDFLKTQNIRHNPYLAFDNEKQKTFTEGTVSQVTQTRYERNPFARASCIKYYGYSCSICEFDFEKHYGELGKNFIHVHHLTQVAAIGKPYQVDPIEDLRPVCPNCHAMLHKQSPPLTIVELKMRLK